MNKMYINELDEEPLISENTTTYRDTSQNKTNLTIESPKNFILQ